VAGVTEAERAIMTEVVNPSPDPIGRGSAFVGLGATFIDMCTFRWLTTLCLLRVEHSGYLIWLGLKQL
jgi:hypothetical protein